MPKWRSDILVLCNSAGTTPDALLPTSDAAQAPQASPDESAQAPASPVLLVFACGEEGQQHADALHDAVSRHSTGVQLVSGFQLFTAVQSMESSSLQFHSGVLSACAKAYQQCQAGQGTILFVAALKMQLAMAEQHVTAAQSQTEVDWKNAKHMWEASSQLQQDIAAAATTCMKPDLRKWGACWLQIEAGSELGDQLSKVAAAMSRSADLKVIVTSTPEPSSALLDFWSSFNTKERNLLAQMLTKLPSNATWQQAALAAFFIQDPREIAVLSAIVHESTVELLVTLALQCTKITLSKSDHVNGLYDNGKLAQCDVSVQLYAYASRQMQGEHVPCQLTLCNVPYAAC